MAVITIDPDRVQRRFVVVAVREPSDPETSFWLRSDEYSYTHAIPEVESLSYRSVKRAKRKAERWERKLARQARRHRRKEAMFEAERKKL